MNNLYVKLASSNIKNSRQFYLPYLLTGMLSVAMFYTMMAIQYNDGIDQMRGAASLKMILAFGTYVIGIFVFIFLFYTNSFIIKRRKKELGIYNILGMEKKHIAKELALETLFAAGVSIGGGLVLGIAFNKLLMMFLYKLVGFTSPIQFSIPVGAVGHTVRLFGIIFAATLCYDMLQVKSAKPIELLQGGNVGEKEPKTKFATALLGVICLGAGYYIAITTESPVDALTLFFIAVVLVIVGTYCLFTAGSIAFLKLLRKNKKYYYQTKHFTAVSGMIYRMKQNAVGLANICILSTMVLVMISTTVCLYAGINDELKSRYPGEISISGEHIEGADHGALVEEMKEVVRENGRTVTSELAYTSLYLAGMFQDGEFVVDHDSVDENASFSDITVIYFLTREDYEAAYDVTLDEIAPGQVEIVGSPEYTAEEFKMLGKTYQVTSVFPFESESDNFMAEAFGGIYYVILPNDEALSEIYAAQQEKLGEYAAEYDYSLYIDIDGTREEKIACDHAVDARLQEIKENSELTGCTSLYGEYRELNRSDFYASNGGFLFLGLFLGIMFLMVTVLIIFYKQISEGYDDKERFAIMEKVGMSNREVKATISAQIRLVFILPIATAALHVAAAFPMIKRLLMLFNLMNGTLFAICLAGTVLVFGVIYLIVFLMTSKSYYKIVGNQV